MNKRNKPATVLAIRAKYRTLANFAKPHNLNLTALNDLLYRRGAYDPSKRFPRKFTNGYFILQTIIKEGFQNELTQDGWDCSQIDLNFEAKLAIRKSTLNTDALCLPIPKYKAESLESTLRGVVDALCSLDDMYNCNFFISTIPEAGPIAILLTMENSIKHTNIAVKLLSDAFTDYEFNAQSSDVITIWEKE